MAAEALSAAEAATSGAINASTIQKVFKALFTFTSSTTDAWADGASTTDGLEYGATSVALICLNQK